MALVIECLPSTLEALVEQNKKQNQRKKQPKTKNGPVRSKGEGLISLWLRKSHQKVDGFEIQKSG
jgi:hypothetical protein